MAMRRMFSGFLAGTLLISAGVGGGLALAHAAKKLYVNGKVASTDLIEKNGKVYAPISEIAKGLNMVVMTKPDGYEITAAGGANQIGGLNGKVGDAVSNGQVVFKVVEVVRGEKYNRRFDKGEITASDGKELVVVICRMKNATKLSPIMSPFGGDETALTDTAEHSFEQFTGMSSDIPERGPKMLPGAAVDFALVFAVPKGTELKDLVYQVAVYDGNFKRSTFRISLAAK